MRWLSENGYCTAAFPVISERLRAQYSIEELSLRPFGILYEDLAINFDRMLRPVLETQITRRCTESIGAAFPPEDFFLDLEVGTRVQCLLTITALVEGSENITLDLRCKNPACRQEIEVEQSLSQLGHIKQQDGPIKVQMGNEEYFFRRPTGRDQLHWLSQSYDKESTEVLSMAERLAIEKMPEMPKEACSPDGENPVKAIGEALKSSDPLACFRLRVKCPECGQIDSHSMDLGAWALKKFRKEQDGLIDTIHTLAYRYHRTEEQIAQIPHWRRSRYLARIEKEEAR